MVSRPEYASKKRKSKTFVYTDGTQRMAHVGMVDAGGVSCYMLDTGNGERFTYAEYNELIAQAEQAVLDAQKRESDAIIELEAVKHDNERLILALKRAVDVSHELFDICAYFKSFKFGEKTRFMNILSNLRRDYRDIKSRVGEPDGEEDY